MIPDILKSRARLLYELGVIDRIDFVIMRSDGRFSKIIVISAVVMITLYALVMCLFTVLNIQNHTNVFPPQEFTLGYFAFWTVEVVMLATLRKSKIKNKHEKEENIDRIFPGGLKKAESDKGGDLK